MPKPIPESYFQHHDVLFLAQDLLGKKLYTLQNGILTGGTIIETEAYRGPEDRASHAFNNRRTPRNEVMYHPGGVAYVYLCYGIHYLFNMDGSILSKQSNFVQLVQIVQSKSPPL